MSATAGWASCVQDQHIMDFVAFYFCVGIFICLQIHDIFFIFSIILLCFFGFLFSWGDFVDVLDFCLFFEKEPKVG